MAEIPCMEKGPPDDGHPSMCMLPAGHPGAHAFEREDQISLIFTETGDTFTMAEARAWFDKWKAEKR